LAEINILSLKKKSLLLLEVIAIKNGALEIIARMALILD
jgi:hypothetical protein